MQNPMRVFDLFTDGSYHPLLERGAWACVIETDGHVLTRDSSDGPVSSSVEAELAGIVMALRMVPAGTWARVHTDAVSVILLARNVLFLSRERGYEKKLGAKIDPNLIYEFKRLLQSRFVSWFLVPSSGTPQNLWCHGRCLDQMTYWKKRLRKASMDSRQESHLNTNKEGMRTPGGDNPALKLHSRESSSTTGQDRRLQKQRIMTLIEDLRSRARPPRSICAVQRTKRTGPHGN